ncbi:ATP-binding protein [Thermodesulfobacteriota bacterium]
MNLISRLRAHRKQYPLSHRLVLYVVLWSVFLTVLSSAFQLYSGYRNDLAAVHNNVEYLESNYLKAIGTSSYYVRIDQMKSQLKDALGLKGIAYLEVSELRGSRRHVVAAEGDPDAVKDEVMEFPLSHTDFSGDRFECGTLKVIVDLREIYGQLWKRAAIILVSNAIQIFLVSLFVLLIIHRLLMRHLTATANYARSFGLDTLNNRLALDRGRSSNHTPDELDQIVSGLNEMRLRMIDDIAERKLAEKALKKSEARFRRIYEDAPVMMNSVDKAGVIRNANKKWLTVLGYPRNEVVGRKIDMIMTPGSREGLFSALDQLWRKGRGNEIPYQFVKKDGTRIDVLVDSIVWNDPTWGTVSLAAVRDVTQQVLLQKQLIQSQKMEAVGTLAGGIAHDFNNLLHVIQGYADLALLAHIREGQPGHEQLMEIKQAARSAAELTHGLLTFSRQVESSLRPVDLNEALEQVARMLRRTIPKMIDIELNLADDLGSLHADPTQLQQVVMNLALNGVGAMPNGGKLIIETGRVSLDKDYCNSHLGTQPGDYTLLTVSDTGCGMDKATVEHIFEPFFTTKEAGKGTGLGLAIVFGIVKSHGGNIICYSEPGEGTCFKIYLPIAAGTHEETELEESEASVTGDETILFVDDEESVRTLGESILERYGYCVLTAPNMREGLEVYAREQDRISLVILDLIMPGMSGRECLGEILKINPSEKVLIASGYAANGQMEKALEEGAKALVRKPYEAQQLLQMIRRVLDET